MPTIRTESSMGFGSSSGVADDIPSIQFELPDPKLHRTKKVKIFNSEEGRKFRFSPGHLDTVVRGDDRRVCLYCGLYRASRFCNKCNVFLCIGEVDHFHTNTS